MPKFAHFNAVANPAPVIAWYDTDSGEWPNLPGSDYLVEATPAQWAARDTQQWQVRDRTLEPMPGITLAQAQAAQLALMDAAFDAAVQAPVAYMGTTFQADKDSRDLMSQAITGLQSILAVGGTIPAGFAWWDASNTPVPMTLAQLQGLYATGVATFNTLFIHKQAQKAAIRAASTVAAVQSITW